MVRNLTTATRALAVATIVSGGLFANSIVKNCSNKQEQVQTEQTESHNIPWSELGWGAAFLALSGATIVTNEKRHIASQAAKYNIPVDMYRRLTKADYGQMGECMFGRPSNIASGWPLLEEGESEIVLSGLSKIENRIDGYRNKYPQLNILNDNQEKKLRECIEKLRNKINSDGKLKYDGYYNDLYDNIYYDAILSITKSNKNFPNAFNTGLDKYFKD